MMSSSTPEVVEAVDAAILLRLRDDDGTDYTRGFNNGVRAAQVVAHQAVEARAAIAALPPSNMIGEAIEALEPVERVLAEVFQYLDEDDGYLDEDDGGELLDRVDAARDDLRKARATLSKLRGEG